MNAWSPAISRLAAALVLAIAAGVVSAQVPFGAEFACSNCPLRISDAGALQVPPEIAEAELTVPAGVCDGADALGGVEVRVDLLHANIGDLRLRLRAPGGATYTVLDRLSDGSGGGAGDGSCAGDDVWAGFSDNETSPPPSCGEQIPSVRGSVQSQTSLAALVAPIAAGTWTLEAGDYADAGDGAIRDWQLHFYCRESLLLFRDGFED